MMPDRWQISAIIFSRDAARAVLRRYDELSEVSRQAVAKRMSETNDFAIGT
jgi:hypothetical protein